MSILLTGGAGYIGSHAAVEFLNRGKDVIIADNLYNSDISVIDKLREITGKRPKFYRADVSDPDALEPIFRENDITAVVHFAGYKAVGESVRNPLMYYRNNLDTTLTLLETMKKHGCTRIVFSSSATVYGEPDHFPVTEDFPVGSCTNPYGKTKYFIEEILRDYAKSEPGVSVVLLRYFNPIGAHESGLIGEKPNGIPNNLMPYITQTAAGIREKLSIFGNDYPTKDGTGVRDYIHVVDLAKGHVCALDYAETHTGAEVFNLGTGNGVSVLELVHAFEKANNIRIPYTITERRPGDIPALYADPTKAENQLHWKAEKTVEDMCKDSWRFQSNQ